MRLADLFRGLLALPVSCPYRAEQTTGLAGGYDFLLFWHFLKKYFAERLTKREKHGMMLQVGNKPDVCNLNENRRLNRRGVI